MSMKKKFLALALAGAVAMPVVANASSNTQVVDGLISQPQNADVKITGTVNNKQGVAPAGKISVELPSAMSFVVDENSAFTAAGNFNITNKGQESVDVSVVQFSETKQGSGITMVERTTLEGDPSNYDRSNISLVLRNGASKKVDLASSSAFSVSQPYEIIDDLQTNQTVTLTVDGMAGTKRGSLQVDPTTTATVDDIGTNEEFIVKFKISKHA